MVNTIICPQCKEEIELSEALTHQIQEQISSSLASKHQKELEEVKLKSLEFAKKEIDEKSKLEMEDLKKQLEERDKKVAEFRDQELKLREEKRKVEEEKKELKLEVERQIDEEKKKIEETVLKQATEDHRLKDLEKEKIINDLKKSLEDAQRKANQGSQQLQGEVLELDIEQMLRSSFNDDVIEPVEKGVRGADIRQIVKTKRGNLCGVILWESKRTKSWSDGWITKLKDDLRAEKANVPIIVSETLPEEAKSGMGLKDGVWICSFPLILPLAEILRQKLIEVAKERYLAQNRGEKAEELYSYITSHEFGQHVEALAEVYKDMHSQIIKERASFEKIWKTREVQIQKLFKSTAGIMGEMQGIIGASSMLQIKGLEFMEIESGEE